VGQEVVFKARIQVSRCSAFSVDPMGFPVCGQGVENPEAMSCMSLRLPWCLSVQMGDERVLSVRELGHSPVSWRQERLWLVQVQGLDKGTRREVIVEVFSPCHIHSTSRA
jgi:hypothetical protein